MIARLDPVCSLTGFDVEGAWRPAPSDYEAIVGRKPSYSAGSLHISSRALDINQLHYKDLNNKPLAYKINNDGYIKDPQGGWLPKVESSELFNSFRRNLYGDGSGVKELYDPWEMVKNGNERLNSPKVLEKTDLSYLHRNHLHLSLTRR